MPASPAQRRVIFNADDFGRSPAINQAVIRAHLDGVLTSASLMVNGDACDDAVALARAHPRLGVGLHLTLVQGRATLPRESIPDLVNAAGAFSDHAVAAGLRGCFQRALRPQLAAEIRAQIGKFHATGLPLDHLNGHLHFHLHPTVFDLLLRQHEDRPLPAIRLTRDPFWLNARLARGRWGYRLAHALIFGALGLRARRRLRHRRLVHADAVFGLLQNGRMTETYLLRLLPRLPAGNVEIYFHPDLAAGAAELAALTSPRVKELIKKLGIQPGRYQDL